MVEIDVLVDSHISKLSALDDYEKRFDSYLKAVFDSQPFMTELILTIQPSSFPLGVLLKLKPKYEAAGWLFQLSCYPSVVVSVRNVTDFNRKLEAKLKEAISSITGISDLEESKRAVKI